MAPRAAQVFERLEEICRAMAEPSFYPHSVAKLERIDTHISVVFLTGTWVYKLKKPVDFGFLDFTSLEARRWFCEREVALNRRLSEGVYQGVVEIREDGPGRLSLGGEGRVVEYAVKMRQLPDATSLEVLLKLEKVGEARMRELGRRLAGFYEHSRREPEIDRFGELEAISFNVEENFRQLDPFIDGMAFREKWNIICQVSRSFLRIWQDLFRERIDAGRIRDGHGDLRADHVYFYRGIQIIDCIEFNDRFRYGDAAIDLAFLHMDLEHRGHPRWSRLFMAAYAERAGDPGVYALLDFYAAYRAIVRAKVACLHSSEMESRDAEPLKRRARAYLERAYEYAVRFSRPTIWVFCGLPASGKSTLAQGTADALKMPVFQSDQVRREKDARSEVVDFGEGRYRTELRHLVYAKLLALAQESVKSGRSVALDATYALRKWRDEVIQLARDLNTNIIFVECSCPEEAIRARLEEREGKSGQSDARLRHLPDMIAHFEPLDDLPPHMHIEVDTTRPYPQPLHEALSKAYALKCTQVKSLLEDISS